MTTFAALLRGINVGTGNRLPMADLRSLLEQLGYSEVRTLLASGNALFDAATGTPADHARILRDALKARFGFDLTVIVKTREELTQAAGENPFASPGHDPSRVLLAFTADPPSLAALASLATLVAEPEAFALGSSCAYIWCPNGTLECQAAKALLGKAGRAATTRNGATVLKILALF